MIRAQPLSPLFPYTTLFRSVWIRGARLEGAADAGAGVTATHRRAADGRARGSVGFGHRGASSGITRKAADARRFARSEEHTSELQSLRHLVCRLLLEKKNTK